MKSLAENIRSEKQKWPTRVRHVVPFALFKAVDGVGDVPNPYYRILFIEGRLATEQKVRDDPDCPEIAKLFQF